jgi:hypothetical protein
MSEESKGQRRPQPEDIPDILEDIARGSSLRQACIARGMHVPTTYAFIKDDPRLSANYTRAKELRQDAQEDQALALTLAAATGRKFEGQVVKADGVRVFLDAIKWSAGRMADKTVNLKHSGSVGVFDPSHLSDERIAALAAALADAPAAGGDAEDSSRGTGEEGGEETA